MTPKERAQAIYDKFYVDVDSCDEHYDNQASLCKHQAKQCSIICVEQILEAVTTIADKKYDYYKEVLNILKGS